MSNITKYRTEITTHYTYDYDYILFVAFNIRRVCSYEKKSILSFTREKSIKYFTWKK